MKPLISIACILLLTGCSSAAYLRDQPASLDGSSDKSPAALAQCVHDQWARHGIESDIISEGSGNSSVRVPRALGGYQVLLDVKAASQGSDFSLHERLAHLTSVVFENGVAFCK